MNLNQFLAELAERGVKLWLEGDTLRFRAPKGVMTSEDRDLLVLHKAKLISLLSQSNTSANDTDQTIVPVSETQDIPLSFAQERLWFWSQLEPNNPSYNELFALRCLVSLNIVALEYSLNNIVARHEALRTNFTTVNGQPVQVVAESLTLTVSIIDLGNLPASAREVEAQRLATVQAQQPFDLASEPLIRATVLKLTETEYVLLLNIHHIVWDGHSLGIILRELAAFYSAFCNDSSLELPSLPLQYPEFTFWQRQRLTGDVLDAQRAYWQQQLLDAPALLELPTDRVRGVTQTFRGAHQRFVLSKELTEALMSLSQRRRVTLFMTLLAAFQTLLYRYTEQTDLCIGTQIANRDRAELEGLIGFLVNTLVLRTRFSGNSNFEDLLSRVREVTLKAYAHRDLPFEKLVEMLQPERSLSCTPLVQVMLVLLSEIPEIQMEGLTASPLPIETGMARFDLTLCIENSASGLIGEWEYNTDLFDDTTIARMTGHFQTLLEAIVVNPKQLLSELPLLSTTEQHQLLVEWSSNELEPLQDGCVHQFFEAQVEQRPDVVAVVFQNQQLTYCELNRRANQLAHYLQTLGVGPEVFVGICMERSLEMVVAVLGVLKAGGAYVPIDPSYPEERLTFILKDSQVQILLTQERLKKSLPKHDAQTVCLDTNWVDIAQNGVENLFNTVTTKNLAYVTYTSGSTGQPKGAKITHCSILGFMFGVDYVQLDAATIFLQHSSISWDALTLELWSPLLNGGRCILYSEKFPIPEKLGEAIKTYGVNTLWLTSALFNTIIDTMPEVLFGVKQLLIGGEAVSATHVRRALKQLPNTQIVNGYGPSECTVFTCCYPIPKLLREDIQSIPIGKPIGDRKVYLLDTNLKPVPIGVAGEVYVGGESLARGYLNRAELTAEKFVPNPYSTEPGARLYKAGDLVRYLADGNIEFLGRTDNQVKIRGFRIELREIEAVLSEHPSVRETIVLVREDTPGNKYLVAYVVPFNMTPSAEELRSYLKRKLPDYMLPAVFLSLESWPLTPNGKINRNALPVPSRDKLEFTAPRTRVEELLVNIWTEVLKLEQVGVHDNFFELGGHSLLATQVVSRIYKTFQVDLPVRSLFEEPTAAKLAQRIDTAKRAKDLPLEANSYREKIPLSYAQERLWFFDQFKPGSAFYNIPSHFQMRGRLRVEVLEKSLEEIVRRHEVLRTLFLIDDGNPIQVIQPDVGIKLAVVDLQELPAADRKAESLRLATEEAQRPFDLSQGSLLRTTLLHLEEEEHLLLLTIHHVVFDGWSIGVFMQELCALYAAFSKGKPSPLKELPIQYADFAYWQRQWLQGEVLETQLAYWKKQLGNNLAVLQLPTDHPRPALQTFSGAQQAVSLPETLVKALRKLSQQEGVSLFMVLLAGFKTLLYRYTGQKDIVVGSPIANRNRVEIEGLIGFFVNNLVLRTNCAGNPSFRELLTQAREVCLEAYTHQDLPFEKLVEQLQPERNLSHNPLFQVAFVLQNALLKNVELPGLSLKSLEVDNKTAKCDLELSWEETGEELRGSVQYNTDLFESETIGRFVGHYQRLLESIVADPQQRLSELIMLTAGEEQQIRVEWNHTAKNYPDDKCIHELFEAQVEQRPDAVAVVCGDEHLTYQELNQRANQWGHYLQTLGVKPEVLVGVCSERSLETASALLGVLKAGGAYMPLDPSYPKDRLSFMLQDSQVTLILTQQKFAEGLAKQQAQIVCLDSDWEVVAQESQENVHSRVRAENLAYVIYTSGSTGQPKGVALAHQGLCNLVQAQAQSFGVREDSRVLQFASLSFDASVAEIFVSLTAGATLYLRKSSSVFSDLDLMELLGRQSITVATLPPSVLSLLPMENLPALESMIVAGESASGDLVKHWGQGRRFFNAYGPTESTVCASLLECSGETGLQKLPIGFPIANTQIYLLDDDLQLVPIGVAGEIHISSVGLARGYLHRPELTAEKFIPHPFSETPGARLYKTGDLARYLPDGKIEFLGRIDHQVKIRGFRIELEEIEAMLSQHPAVLQTVVMAREDIPGNQRLVAYVVLNQNQSVTTTALNRFLEDKLPNYMVPSLYLILDSLPLTANGKVNHQALPVPEILRPELETGYVAPETDIEHIIASVWQELLHIQKVGIHDNFFDLGGHSLLLIQVQKKLQTLLQKEISFVELFKYSSIHALVTYFSQEQIEQPSFQQIKSQSKKQKDALQRQKRLMKKAINQQKKHTGKR
jgi:amino acid adenylation domain-containing protein